MLASFRFQDAPSRLVNKELQDSLPPKVRGYWPKEATVKRHIQRERRKHFPALPDSLSQPKIPVESQKSANGEQFLICDHSLKKIVPVWFRLKFNEFLRILDNMS